MARKRTPKYSVDVIEHVAKKLAYFYGYHWENDDEAYNAFVNVLIEELKAEKPSCHAFLKSPEYDREYVEVII